MLTSKTQNTYYINHTFSENILCLYIFNGNRDIYDCHFSIGFANRHNMYVLIVAPKTDLRKSKPHSDICLVCVCVCVLIVKISRPIRDNEDVGKWLRNDLTR